MRFNYLGMGLADQNCYYFVGSRGGSCWLSQVQFQIRLNYQNLHPAKASRPFQLLVNRDQYSMEGPYDEMEVSFPNQP